MIMTDAEIQKLFERAPGYIVQMHPIFYSDYHLSMHSNCCCRSNIRRIHSSLNIYRAFFMGGGGGTCPIPTSLANFGMFGGKDT